MDRTLRCPGERPEENEEQDKEAVAAHGRLARLEEAEEGSDWDSDLETEGAPHVHSHTPGVEGVPGLCGFDGLLTPGDWGEGALRTATFIIPSAAIYKTWSKCELDRTV